MGFRKQMYIDQLSGEQVEFQVASVLVELSETCHSEWVQAYSRGTMGKIVVSTDGVSVERGGLFYLDVDTRRAESEEEIAVNLSQLLPPFICVSVLFAVADSHEGASIGPHMDDSLELSFSRQLAEWCKKIPHYNSCI